MLHTVFGVVLIVLPFLGVFFYQSIHEGLLKITLYTAIFHVVVSIITQGFHIFNYPVVVGAHLFFSILLIYILYIKTAPVSIRRSRAIVQRILKNNWIFFIALVIIFFQLFSVHYAYTGTVQTLRGQTHVIGSYYPYPFVSDEWVTVALVNYSVSHNALPVVNPLDHNRTFPNILFIFSSLVAELFLLTGLNPFIYYSMLSIVVGLILCASLYVLLKKYGVSSFIATAAVLCVPYIANSGNLSAMWALLPFTVGSIFLLWQLIAQRSCLHWPATGFLLLGLLVYPPIVVFAVPALLAGLLKIYSKNSKELTRRFGMTAGLGLLAAVILFCLAAAPFGIHISDVFSKYIVRSNPDFGIVSYPVWNVIPFFVLIFSVAGFYTIMRKAQHEILAPFCIGVLYWCAYVFINKVFIIENPRIVVITSVLLIFLAGIGAEWLVNVVEKMQNHSQMVHRWLHRGIGIFAVVVSLSFLSSYASYDQSRHFVLNRADSNGNVEHLVPTVAANRYLTADDVRVFHDIHNATFIAPPWKGLVLTVGTSNTAMETKAATITNSFVSYSTFLRLDCDEKKQVAFEYGIQYVYAEPFSCPQFHVLASSTEGLYLYQYKE